MGNGRCTLPFGSCSGLKHVGYGFPTPTAKVRYFAGMISITRYSLVWGVGLLGLSNLSIAKEIDNLVCKEEEVTIVLPQAMKIATYQSTSIYRFTVKGLSLSSSDRAEYFYNTVRYVEPGRFVSGHKTFLFKQGSFSKATAVHAHETEIKISKLSCM